MSYLCGDCGNKTRFDVFESKRVRAFQHFSLGGEMTIEEEEVLDLTIERVICRWCGSAQVEEQGEARARTEEATSALEGKG